MSKLFKLKKFVTIEEAAKYLSSSLEESVSLSDIYRLVIDKHLTLSVRLINPEFAVKGQIVNGHDGDWVQLQTDLVTGEVLDEPYSVCINDNSVPIGTNKWFMFDEQVHVVDGVWDLAMIGMESLHIERLYQNEVNGPEPVVTKAQGIYLQQGELVCRLQKEAADRTEEILADIQSGLEFILEPKGISVDDFLSRDSDNLYNDLTDDDIDNVSFLLGLMRNQVDSIACYEDSLGFAEHSCQFVIKTMELARFLQSLDDEPPAIPKIEEELSAKERNTLLTLIGALCNELNIDLSVRGVTASVQAMTELAGTPISDDTIRKILKEVPTAQERRQK
ncbi:hypothetical protein C0W44_14135 [Photobacterium leiognathi subsp. mandapamensis]|uniref:hypothetical protein n=1 Tax=Photobacterium leiognathi TaxID=553611 RepID=UPI000D153994|nr:hypothetical protein [Photobacterium leiognathi]PSV19683.1 hypothetical protein C0W44_14135 [Photobacterium leiognathi subsp. mandapamensis]